MVRQCAATRCGVVTVGDGIFTGPAMGKLRAGYGPYDYATHPQYNGWYFGIFDLAEIQESGCWSMGLLFGVYVTAYPDFKVPRKNTPYVRWSLLENPRRCTNREKRVHAPHIANLILSRAPVNVVLDAILECPQCPPEVMGLVQQIDWSSTDE